MRNRLLVSFILFAFVAMSLLVIPVGIALDAHEHTATLNALRRDTSALATLLSADLSHGHLSEAAKLARAYSHATKRQILVSDVHATLIATKGSQALDQKLEQLASHVGARQHFGVIARTPVEGPQYYVAMELSRASNVALDSSHVALVVTYPVTVSTRTIRSNWRNLIFYGLVMFAIAVVFGLLISNSLTRPLRNISATVHAVGAGDLRARAPTDAGPSELRRLAETVNATSTRLDHLLMAQKSFVADASHQLRTPLTALRLHLENLASAARGDAGDEYDSLLSEIARLSNLVDSLLALARNESRHPLLVPVNATQFVIDRVDFWRPFADELAVSLTGPASTPFQAFMIDGAIEQIMDNLLSNAFDVTPVGGHVTVTLIATRTMLELHVIDSGPGLSDAERTLALRRFWRGDTAHGEGSGLGLAIVDQLVRLCGGTIELRRAPTGGLDVTVQFRRADGPETN